MCFYYLTAIWGYVYDEESPVGGFTGILFAHRMFLIK